MSTYALLYLLKLVITSNNTLNLASITYYVPFLRPRYKYCRASYDPPFNVFILLFVYNKAMVGIQLNRFLNCDGLNLQWIAKYFIRPI